MQTSKLKTCLGLVLLFCNLTVRSQAFSATYTYDANGNRLSATIIYLTSTIKSEKIPISDIIKDSTVVSDSIPKEGWNKPSVFDMSGSLEIKLYPNPSHGRIMVELSGIIDKQLSGGLATISVFDMAGTQIINKRTVSIYNNIDLSSRANGTYLLRINVNGDVKIYKVIKE